jgi:hypothetical protein
LYASVFEEPVTPHASTKRERARRRYTVQYDTGSALMGNPPKGYIPCKAVKIVRNKGRIEVRVKR